VTFALVEPNKRADFRSIAGPHSAKASTDVWLTTPYVLQALGEFDLDPCAAPEPRPWPTARTHIALPEDGLKADWPATARVWLKPPYGRQTGTWLQRLADHGNGIALIFARTDTDMFFEQVWLRGTSALFLRGRLTFYSPRGEMASFNAGGPSVLVAYGEDNATVLRNCGLAGRYLQLRHDQ
jgi:hypothetical protein